MNLGEEKVFLYGMMKDITEERRRLTDMYFSLKERIDMLHKLEEKGLDEISTKGFIDLFNDRETQLRVANVNREMQYAKELMKPRYDKVAETLERGQADREAEREQAIQKAKAEADNDERVQRSLLENEQVKVQFEEKEKPKKPKKESRIRTGLSTKEALFLVQKILKENGILKTSELHELVVKKSGYDITFKNFSGNIMNRVMQKDPKIERVGTGLFQYTK